MGVVGRFAPSTTGDSHPGTLAAALLCWLDARSAGGRVALRLEDLDPDRSREDWVRAMADDLAWLGLDWDEVARQSEARERHEAALDRLAADGRLYPCACSRARIREGGERAPDGSFRYPNRCRGRALPVAGWRDADEPLRAALDPGVSEVEDEDGRALGGDATATFGDPVVRRRDGAVAYHLASVVDDAALGVTRVVRGNDLAPSTLTQVALQQALGLPTPVYRHHLLLLEERGDKLAKLHGAVGAPALRRAYDGPGLCGVLARAVGLREDTAPATPAALLETFDWDRVATHDRVVRWTGEALQLLR